MEPEPRSAAFSDTQEAAALEQQALDLLRQGRLHEGEAVYRNLIAAGTDNHITYGNLAAICGMTGRLQEAGELLRKVLVLNPAYPEGHNNLGNTLQDQDELEQAVVSYRNALSLREAYPEAHYNLGNALHRLGDIPGALQHYRRALAIRPDDDDVKANLSMALLLSGDYGQGWAEYECRLSRPKVGQSFSAWPPCEPWSGDPLRADRPLLLVCEQGLGDSLQFMRYLLPLRRHGVEAHLCAPTQLHGLIRGSGLDPAPLTPEQGNAFRDGAWLPLLSLPGRLGVHPGDPIVCEPYLATTPERIEAWRRRLADEPRPIVALHWQGHPDNERTNSRGRSLPLETFAPLSRTSVGSLLSLQKGFGSEQLARCSFRERFVACQDEVDAAWDLQETAAILANCDLLISSDSAIAHLAGALGHPVWLLLKAVPEWRWGLEGDTTFWYPSMRLFRQRRRGDWAEVVERVARALAGHGPAGGAPLALDAPPSVAPEIPAPLSLGELVDRIVRLELQAGALDGAERVEAERRLEALRAPLAALPHRICAARIDELREVNASLRRLEAELRAADRSERSGGEGAAAGEWLRLAGAIQRQRERRAALRQAITQAWGEASAIR